MEACSNPDILKVIMFILQIIKLIFFVVPIGLIIILGLDFFKNVIASNESDMKKNMTIAIKRIVFCVCIFFVPTIVSLMNGIIGIALEDTEINYTECITNAKSDKINSLINDLAEVAYNNALSDKTLESILEAQDAINKMNDKTKAKKMLDDIEKIKENIISNATEEQEENNIIPNTNINKNNAKKAKDGEGLWVAHMKNSPESVKSAIDEGFWGIEVDVQQVGNDFKLYHDSRYVSNYLLSSFLDTCKENDIVAVLDFKTVYDYEKIISLVKEKNMEKNTIYQTSASVEKKLYAIDKDVRIWILISDSYTNIDITTLSEVKDFVEGVNMLALNTDENDIKKVHDLGLTFCSFSYLSKLYNNADATKLRSWGTNYIAANNIDES